VKKFRTPLTDPNRHEWDFERLPSDQLEECLWYEYGRKSPKIIQAVKTWRKWRRLKPAALAQQRIFPGRQFVHSQRLRILTLCPEFPAKTWQDIQDSKRVKRIKRRRTFLASFETQIRRKSFQVLDPLAYPLRVQAMIPRAQAAKDFPGFQHISHGGAHDIFCEIDFDQNEGVIIRDFTQWVRNAKRQQAKRRDRDRTSRTCQELLKALGAWRLLDHYRQAEPSQEKAIRKAIDYTQQVKGKPIYSSRESWLRAVGQAKEYLSGL
jgi:hypothetical protein